jgi:hypothetical protein
LRKKNKYARDAGKDAALKIAIFQGFLPRRSGPWLRRGIFMEKKSWGRTGRNRAAAGGNRGLLKFFRFIVK